MSPWRKKLFGLILVVLLVLSIVFWGTMAGGCCLIALIQIPQVYMFNKYATSDLAKTFQEDGQNVKGWRS